jgi:hypothetical protein
LIASGTRDTLVELDITVGATLRVVLVVRVALQTPAVTPDAIGELTFIGRYQVSVWIDVPAPPVTRTKGTCIFNAVFGALTCVTLIPVIVVAAFNVTFVCTVR